MDNLVDAIKQRDIDIFHDTHKKCGLSKLHITTVVNLNESLDILNSKIAKNYRYEIKKTLNLGYSIKHHHSDIINEINLLNQFKIDYINFTRSKKIKNTFNERALNELIKQDKVVISSISKNEEIFAYHVYVQDTNVARLLYSVSNFRDTNLDPSVVGMANKRLHWEDIKFFKENKIETLDLGGISNFENPNGVDRFKLGFGGEKKELYINYVGVSIIGKLIIYFRRHI